MPKDPTRNIDSYKIRGGQINQFDYVRNHNEISQEQQPVSPDQDNPIPFPSEQQQMERVRQLLEKHGEPTPGHDSPGSEEQKPESPLEFQNPMTTQTAGSRRSEDPSPARKTAQRASKKPGVKSAPAPKKQGAKKQSAARTATKKISSSKKASSSKSSATTGKASGTSRSSKAGVKKSVRAAKKTVASSKATKQASARISSAKATKGKKMAGKKRSTKTAGK
jgi:hypothetical protein